MIDLQNVDGYSTIVIEDPDLIGTLVSQVLPLKFSSFNFILLQGFDARGDFQTMEYADSMLDGLVSAITEGDESMAVSRREIFNPLFMPTTTMEDIVKSMDYVSDGRFASITGVTQTLTETGEEGIAEDANDSYTLKTSIVTLNSEQLNSKVLLSTFFHEVDLPGYGKLIRHFNTNKTLNTIN